MCSGYIQHIIHEAVLFHTVGLTISVACIYAHNVHILFGTFFNHNIHTLHRLIKQPLYILLDRAICEFCKL